MVGQAQASSIPVAKYPDLSGKVAVVTGGSKGIGAATCRMLATNGVKVAIVARKMDAIDTLVAELRKSSAEVIGLSADVTQAAELRAVQEQTECELGPVDILIPYAGGFTNLTPIWKITEEEWRRVIDDNLTSTFLAIKTFVPRMMERRRGVVVAMSSITGRFIDDPRTASYAAAKAAVLMLIRHAAVELGPYGIRLNAIAPGTTLSERIERIIDDDGRDHAKSLSPLGRLGIPEDSAAATLFLASDSSSWLTGVTIDVAGGRVML